MNKTQKTIIETTIDIVAEKGMEGFTLREIAKKIGMSHSNVYAYYSTKEELLRECFYFVNREISEIFIDFQISDNISKEVLGNLFYEFWKKYFEFMISNGNHSLFYYAYRESKELEHIFMKNNETVAKDMEHFMAEFSKILPHLDIHSSEEIDYLWVYLLDCTGTFVKHIIKGHTDKYDTEKIWKLMCGGLFGLYFAEK